MISYQGGEGEEKAEMRTNVSWERHLRARRGVGERRKVLTLNGKRSRSRRREREREVKTRKRMSVVGGRNCSHLSSLSSSSRREKRTRRCRAARGGKRGKVLACGKEVVVVASDPSRQISCQEGRDLSVHPSFFLTRSM